MKINRILIALQAKTMYEEELAKKLGVDPHSEYGRKVLNEYLEKQIRENELSARIHLSNKNLAKIYSYNEIRNEASEIEKKRLQPYVEKAKNKILKLTPKKSNDK